MPAYLAAAGPSEGELREKGSVFRAVLAPADSEAAAKGALAAVERRFPDATHWCWAWRLGEPPRERSSDAGEPAGTAGVPILQVLRGRGLSDVVAVVVRWYGGTKLGKGGLARAYAGATREALTGLPVERRVPTVLLALTLPYETIGAVRRLLHSPEVELVAEEYLESVRLVLRVHTDRRDELASALADLGVAAVPCKSAGD